MPGDCELRVIAPGVLELTLITTKPPDPARVTHWDFAGTDGLRLPGPQEFQVTADGQTLPVQTTGFKRRVLYAPLQRRDLRIANHLYLQLGANVKEGQLINVTSLKNGLWPANCRFMAKADRLRHSPAIHVNQVGYTTSWSKQAMVGYYQGSMGELTVPAGKFELVESGTGRVAYRGQLVPRRDRGFTFPSYQKVMEADFTEFKSPGEYRLVIPGLGGSYPFFIDDGVAAAFARTYALGLYHQRCGGNNALPFTRFAHGVCHSAPAAVPNAQFTNMLKFLAEITANFASNPRHTARQLKDFDASLYPFNRRGEVDVSGGHHDAGDYSKYTINSAALIHYLVFAADVFPGAGELDNLGIPESGDGKSDLLQEAKWEADFLARMQDADGGFYFLVYPRNRKYENNVLPDRGDPQIVWPKTTAATAAAVAALAQTASSPLFKKQFPEAAHLYLETAKRGWGFLERAVAKFGKDGAYQKITHYGDDFMHDDELAWAACEMFLATGDPAIHRTLRDWFRPADGGTRKWGWWRMYEGYGCAMRSYAFGAKTGRVQRNQLETLYLAQCENEIVKCGDDELRRAQESAYGTSFPAETKRVRGAGWYFSTDRAFDLAVAHQLDHPEFNDPRPKYLAAILSNLNYEGGCNPVNVCYVTGLGWKRQREIVHHYAMNDRRVLPPSGIPLGNIQAGFAWLDAYKQELGALSYPSDGANDFPYPFYDRWGDSFNVQTEFVIVNQARSLATAAFLMARTSVKGQAWKSSAGRIEIRSESNGNVRRMSARLHAPGLDLSPARIVWEMQDHEPALGHVFSFTNAATGSRWLEAEAQLPDGRRVFATTDVAPAR
ncbi:MAG: glycoside hydrolase family 9 protein [Verrucomicrobiota bacterium]